MMKININIEVKDNLKNYNFADRDKSKVEQRAKGEIAVSKLIGFTTFVTLCISVYKIFDFVKDYLIT